MDAENRVRELEMTVGVQQTLILVMSSILMSVDPRTAKEVPFALMTLASERRSAGKPDEARIAEHLADLLIRKLALPDDVPSRS